MAEGFADLSVDVSDAREVAKQFEHVLGRDNMNKVLYRAFQRVGRSAKARIGAESAKKYAIGSRKVQQSVQRFTMDRSGGVQCIIPLKMVRGGIGSDFKVLSRMSGKKVVAKVYKQGNSELPIKGKRIHFMIRKNIGTKDSPHIVSTGRVRVRVPGSRKTRMAVGIAAPQMPPNLAKEGTQKSLGELMKERVEHEIEYELSKLNR